MYTTVEVTSSVVVGSAVVVVPWLFHVWVTTDVVITIVLVETGTKHFRKLKTKCNMYKMFIYIYVYIHNTIIEPSFHL